MNNKNQGKPSTKISRRSILQGAAALGIGVAVAPLISTQVQAAATGAAQAPAEPPKLTMADVLRVAREKLFPLCRVCPECDGVACAGEVPGFGGIGSGQGFKTNYNSLNRIQFNMRTVHDMKKPDMSVEIFGETLAIPILAAPTGGVTYNMGGKMTEEDYIDSAGRAARALPGQIVEPKTLAQLKELVQCTKMPFILKGVMTVDEAELAVEAGAKGIVVSNHGGRVLDYTPGTADVLPAIAAKVKGKVVIFVDGAVRRGTDVLKLLALGADACLVGRPLIRGAHGAGRQGVALMLNAMRQELMDSMVLTGTASVRNVSRSIIAGA